MFRQMVKIAFTTQLERLSKSWYPSATGLGDIETDLEVDEIRATIIPHNDVLALVQIHVGNPPAVHFEDCPAQPGEEQ